jgi:pilus assembly protein CpaD
MMIRTLSLVAATALAVSACATPQGAGPAPLTPVSRFTLQVEPGLDRIALAVREDDLSPNQQGALAALADRFGAAGADVIRVEAPSGGDAVATAAAWRVKAALEARGLSADRVQVVAYNAPDPRAPVLAGFATYRAAVPQCGQRWGELTNNYANQSQSNFGCAVTANMAAQIANPRDIVAPRDMTLADSHRAAVVFDNYRRGVRTSAPQEELVVGQVSEAVE